MSRITERKSNFELLRIISMVMIVACHLNTQGIKNYAMGALSNRILAAFVLPGGQVGVALFFMLTGYFLVSKRTVSVLKVVAEVIFYGWFLSVLFIFPYISDKIFHTHFNYASAKAILRTIIIPVSSARWWFVTSYILLVLVVPRINQFLEKLNDKGFFVFLLMTWFFWYTMRFLFASSFMELSRAFFFYIFGAYFRRVNIIKKVGGGYHGYSLFFLGS